MDRVELFHNLVNLAAADGKFTDEEIQFLVTRAEAWDVSHDEFETAMAGLSAGEIQITVPDSHPDRVELLKEMIRLMAADGELAETEKRLCAMASANMDINYPQFEQILDEVIAEGR